MIFIPFTTYQKSSFTEQAGRSFRNSFSGLKSFRHFEKWAPGVCFSKVPRIARVASNFMGPTSSRNGHLAAIKKHANKDGLPVDDEVISLTAVKFFNENSVTDGASK